MKPQDTQQHCEENNKELIKSILVKMAVETNIATLQGEKPSKVYEDLNNSAVHHTRFFLGALKKEREDGIKEGAEVAKKGRVTYSKLGFLIRAYKAKAKEKFDDEKLIEWIENGGMKAEEKQEEAKEKAEGSEEAKKCPYCDAEDFDSIGLKNHLLYECRNFINEKEVRD